MHRTDIAFADLIMWNEALMPLRDTPPPPALLCNTERPGLLQYIT